MHFLSFLFLGQVFNQLLSCVAQDHNVLHFAVKRRPAPFTRHEPANLTRISATKRMTEKRYDRFVRGAGKNHLARSWRSEEEGEKHLLDEAGLDGRWYFAIDVGDPVQSLEVDLDLLSSDFYTVMTSSGKGSKYDTFISQSHNQLGLHPHPLCYLSSDMFHLQSASLTQQISLDLPICQASHSSRHTLANAGTILGLAPAGALRHLDSSSLVEQLLARGMISNRLWSITLLDAGTGVLTIGGTLAREVEEAKFRAEAELKYLDQPGSEGQIEQEVQSHLSRLGDNIETQFKWVEVRGSHGHWTGLISRIWVNGVKILKNQPFLIDINCPFILASPSAYTHFATSIPLSKRLPPPHDAYTAFPCLNPPSIALEMGGWTFPLFDRQIRQDGVHGPVGGPFSLGHVLDLDFAENAAVTSSHPTQSSRETAHSDANSNGNLTSSSGDSGVSSGYCIGIIVEADMGTQKKAAAAAAAAITTTTATGEDVGHHDHTHRQRHRQQQQSRQGYHKRQYERDDEGGEIVRWQDAGMKHVWVLGEPFFRGMGVVFDDGENGSFRPTSFSSFSSSPLHDHAHPDDRRRGRGRGEDEEGGGGGDGEGRKRIESKKTKKSRGGKPRQARIGFRRY